MKVFNIIGAIVAVLAYSSYFYLACYRDYFGIDALTWNLIHYLGMYTSLALIFLGFAIKEENIKLKHLVYIPMIGFFVLLIVIYLLNYIADSLIDMDKPLLSTSASISLSLIWYLKDKIWKRS